MEVHLSGFYEGNPIVNHRWRSISALRSYRSTGLAVKKKCPKTDTTSNISFESPFNRVYNPHGLFPSPLWPLVNAIKWRKAREKEAEEWVHFIFIAFQQRLLLNNQFNSSYPLNASLYLSKLIFIIAAVASFYEHHQKLIKTQCVLYLQADVSRNRTLCQSAQTPESQRNRRPQRIGRGTLWNHKGNMLHMHSPKAICIQMLPTHFKNCTITGGGFIFLVAVGGVLQRKRVKAAS